MPDNNKSNQKMDFIIIFIILFLIVGVSLFNYIVDPYFIFRNSTIEGFNNVKPHLFSSKRTILYSDIKINKNRKDTAFIGNCILYQYNNGKDNFGFYTIPATTVEELTDIIKAIHILAPNIKKIYWGLILQDLWFDEDDKATDSLAKFDNPNVNINDLVNLFFSWNTTKYSIETVKNSIKHKNKNSYVFPFKDIAAKKYDYKNVDNKIAQVRSAVQYAKDNGIDLIIYYSPVHVTKKIHMYEHNILDTDVEFKKKLAEITPFYDYSLLNEEYNMAPLDEHSENFIDNVHLTDRYNVLITNDLTNDDERKIGVLITKDNVDKYTEEDMQKLLKYMEDNPDITEKIKNVKPEDAKIKISRID